ncbi:MAG: glycosyltransferase, partial [Sphingopyxis sp.]
DGVNGTLFAPDDPAALAHGVADLLANRGIWDERRRVSRQFVEDQRNWAANIRRYEPVYHHLLGQKSGKEGLANVAPDSLRVRTG